VDGTAHKTDGEVDVQEHPHHPHWPTRLHWPHWPHWPPRKPHRVPHKFIKAVKAVRKINQKLVSFERGFIHEEGIKDREWFRHLGVAPGKWLGKV
jgi:N-acetylated-alpha-linked acidic dipeptidase